MILNVWGDFKIKDLAGRRRYLLFPFLSLVVVVASLLLVFLPNVREIRSGADNLADQKQRLTRLNQKVASLAELDEATLNSQLVVMERVLPTEKPVFALLGSLRKLSGETGVAVSQIDFSPGSLATESAQEVGAKTKAKTKAKSIGGGMLSFPVELTVSGSANSVNEFLKGLELIAPLVAIDDIKFDVRRGGNVLVKGSMRITAYYSSLPTQLGRASDPLPKPKEELAALIETLSQFSYASDMGGGGVPVGKVNLFEF